jgi:protein-disulfide isomerase
MKIDVAEDAPGTTSSTQTTVQKVPSVTDSDHVLGNIETAKVVVIEYSDFQCPYCAENQSNMNALKEEYGDKMALVFRHFPLTSIHSQALPAAMASECAAEQGNDKFWAMADKLFENQKTLGEEKFKTIASEIGLDEKKFSDCLASNKYNSKIQSMAQGGYSAGVGGTPSTFINGTLYKSLRSFGELKSLIAPLI